MYSPTASTGEYNKTDIYRMAAITVVEVTDKEIRESKINSVPKNTKDLYIKILKQLFASVSVIIGEYSPRLRRIIVNLLLLGNIFQNVQICAFC